MYKRSLSMSGLGQLPQPEGRPITYQDIQSALPEVYGQRFEDGTVIVPPVTPIALDQAFTALVEQKRLDGDTEFQFRPGDGDAAYAQLVQQYGSLASIEELLQRYPLVVDWLARRAALNQAYVAQQWEVYRGERAAIDPGALDATAGAVVRATEEEIDQARRAAELPCCDTGTAPAAAPGPGGAGTVETTPYLTPPTGRPDLMETDVVAPAAPRAGSSWLWLAALGGAILLSRRKTR